MTNTIIGVYDDPMAARHAMDDLRASALKLDDLSIVSRSTESGAAVSNHDDVSAGEGATVGAVWGGLVGLAALLIPGVGPFIALGALGAALTGVVTGAVVGGISAALIDFSGIPDEDARAYEQHVHSGKTLVAVKAREEDALEVRRILAHAGADSIRDNQTDITGSSNSAVSVAMYDASGQAVNEAAEYGAPINPTTVRHDSDEVAMPIIESGANVISPVIETTPATDKAFGTGRGGFDEPREDGDDGVADVLTPETLGATGGTAARKSDDKANR